MDNKNLPPGFISVQEACELIKSDDRDKPVVDMDWMIARVNWIDVNNNFRIPRIRALTTEQVYKTRRGKIVEFEHTGDEYVTIRTAFEKELLKQTIRDKYRELVGHEYKEKHARGVSTVAVDGEGRNAVRPRANTPMAKEGDTIGSGDMITTNGKGYF